MCFQWENDMGRQIGLMLFVMFRKLAQEESKGLIDYHRSTNFRLLEI